MPNPYIILIIICMRRQALVLPLYQFKNLPDFQMKDKLMPLYSTMFARMISHSNNTKIGIISIINKCCMGCIRQKYNICFNLEYGMEYFYLPW